VIAVVAGVNQIRVLAAQARCDTLGDLVIELEFTQMEAPQLALQAVDAPEVELVA
jgi:aspartate 1-decarboxylase